MPYIESEHKAKIRQIRNSVEPVLDGITNKLVHYEVSRDDFFWLIKQSEKVEKLQERLDAKIIIINNGWEEERYVLQEENIEYKKSLEEQEEEIRQLEKRYEDAIITNTDYEAKPKRTFEL